MTVQATTKLLDEFGKVSGRVARPRTFMEIAGYPHYENVCSNILAFFMDPEEPHGLGSLVIDALISFGHDVEVEKTVGGSVSVEREVTTSKGRIDILVTSDNHAILIENKIHAGVSNPFDDYANYLDHIADGHTKHKFLLTLYPTNEGSKWGFTNLTHERFVEQIRSLLGRYVSDADTRYLTMFLDFLNTLENLQRGSRMNQEFVKLLADRGDDIRSLFSDMKDFRDDMRSRVAELRDLVVWSQYPSVEREGLWRADTVAMFDTLFHHIRVDEDLLVGVDTRLDPHGWEIRIHPRDKGDSLKLRDILQRLEIKFEKRGGWRRDFVSPAPFAYDANLEQISPILQEIIDKLATFRDA